MNRTTGRDHFRGATRTCLLACCAALAGALAIMPALAAQPDVFKRLPGSEKLSNLEIEIWPEYDRPAALVLLKGEIAPDTNPAISVRIPASSGGPLAVAQSATVGGKLLNLPYERTDGKDYITLRIQPPDRYFHIEFYDKIDTGKDKRQFRYVWPADLPVAQFSLHVQQPAGSTGFSVTPAMTESSPGNDTLIYWSKGLGAVAAGKALPITVSYTKSDARTSKEQLGEIASPATSGAATTAPAANPPAAAPSTSSSAPAEPVPGTENATSYMIVSAIFALLAAAAAGLMWRRRKPSAQPAAAGGFCTRCGNALQPEDRFCSKCGTAVAARARP